MEAVAGLLFPSGEEQAKLLADVYDGLAVKPTDVHYVEAHATGTPVSAVVSGGQLCNLPL